MDDRETLDKLRSAVAETRIDRAISETPQSDVIGSPPPFAGLRLLHAACRSRGFTHAASALGVSHSAVSQAISRLERTYRVALFHRSGGRMEPTPAALALAEAYEAAVRDVERTQMRVAKGGPDAPFVISTLPSIASLWLGRRMWRLRATLSEFALELRTSRELANLETDGVDLAIRFGPGSWAGLHSELLFDEFASPVASPAFVARFPDLSEGRFSDIPLLLEMPWLWPLWFAAANIPLPSDLSSRNVVLDDAGLVIDAAVNARGVALARRVHTVDALENGTLVKVSDVSIQTPLSCYVVWRPGNPRMGRVHAVFEWLLAECERSGLLA